MSRFPNGVRMLRDLPDGVRLDVNNEYRLDAYVWGLVTIKVDGKLSEDISEPDYIPHILVYVHRHDYMPRLEHIGGHRRDTRTYLVGDGYYLICRTVYEKSFSYSLHTSEYRAGIIVEPKQSVRAVMDMAVAKWMKQQ